LLACIIRDISTFDYVEKKPNYDLINSFITENPEVIKDQDGAKIKQKLPDIIVILSESMFDPGILNHIENYEYLNDFRKIMQKGYSGNLTVPTYGGLTIRIEFEFLTSISLKANFPNHRYPYNSLITKPTTSLPRTFKALGYETIAIHPHKNTFWNRNAAFEHLGFDRFICSRDFKQPHHEGPYIADSELQKKIEALLDDNRPQFFFIISMENHGPWGNRPNLDEERRKSILVPWALSKIITGNFRNLSIIFKMPKRHL